MTAFQATYSDLKLIKTRKVVQIIFEIPQEDFDAAYEVLGGLPNPAAERWFGIAALKEVMPDRESTPAERPRPDKTGGAKRDGHTERPKNGTHWRDMSPTQQAGILCNEPSFWTFLREQRPDDWHEAGSDAAECVRLICAVESRSQLIDGPHRVIWHQLDDEYQAWKQVEHA